MIKSFRAMPLHKVITLALCAVLLVAAASPTTTFAQADTKQAFVAKIKTASKLGKVITFSGAAGVITSDKISAQLGTPDESAYVADAKGTYSTYIGDGLVFGVNKGEQVFEIRCFDKSLRTLSQADVIKYLGKPDLEADSTTQSLIGYQVSDTYHLEFVYKHWVRNGKEVIQLDHYNVLYPKGTVNLMSGDSGREW